MDSETEGRFENVEFRLTEAEEKIVSQDAVLSAIRKLILRGMRLLAETQESQKATDIRMRALLDAQIVTEEKLRRLLDRPPNGH
jgi:hypothetical protein